MNKAKSINTSKQQKKQIRATFKVMLYCFFASLELFFTIL